MKGNAGLGERNQFQTLNTCRTSKDRTSLLSFLALMLACDEAISSWRSSNISSTVSPMGRKYIEALRWSETNHLSTLTDPTFCDYEGGGLRLLRSLTQLITLQRISSLPLLLLIIHVFLLLRSITFLTTNDGEQSSTHLMISCLPHRRAKVSDTQRLKVSDSSMTCEEESLKKESS